MNDDKKDASFSPSIILEERGAVAVIRLNRSKERNPLSTHTLERLQNVFAALDSREDVSSIIFTGTGDAFASGANIKELQTLTSNEALEFSRRGQRLFQGVEDARKLTVAAVNGFCMGGGLDLALACRIRVASRTAVFAHPGARLGIITGWGGTLRLPRIVAHAVAFEMFLTGRRLSAKEAFEFGLADYVAESALMKALEIARSQI